MERDFLGLNSKNVAMAAFTQDFSSDASQNSSLMNGSSMQWPFSNKVSVLPQLLSLKACQDEKQRKIVADPPPNLTHHRPCSSNVAQDKKTRTPYATAVYPFHYAEAISVHRSQDATLFPISNRPTNAVPVFQSQLVSPGQPVVGANANLQPFGGVPIATPISVPFTSSVVSSTELRNASKPRGSSTAQLTMFYGGSVCVYNDISPEKAHAIMLLAGSGGLPQTQNNNELPTAAKPTQALASRPNHSEPPKDTCSVSPISPIAPTFVPAAVPQARQASLARFLEKRKERINTCPYSIGKKASDCSSTNENRFVLHIRKA